jgi:hypothetical protein
MPNKHYRKIIAMAKQALCTRFGKRTGSIKSWNTFKSWSKGQPYHYPNIIENMMNMDLLFFAARETGDPLFNQVAVTPGQKGRSFQG